MQLSIYNPSTKDEIKQLFVTAFSDSAGVSEGGIVGNLAYDLMTNTDPHNHYGFVATENEKIIGSIFFTRLRFPNNENALLLSPVAISTDFQGKGIGQKLINFGLDHVTQDAISLVFTYGDPNFYSKMGFTHISDQVIKPPFELSQPDGWLGLSLENTEIKPIEGRPFCVKAFNNPELW